MSGGHGFWRSPTSAVGAADLDALTDVDVSSTPPTDGQALVYDESSGLWVPATVGPGGGGAMVHKVATRTSGDVGISSSTFVPVDTGMDLIIPAAVGDMLELAISCQHSNEALNMDHDVGIVVSGSVARRVSNATFGVVGWNARGGNFFASAGSYCATVQAADVVAGNVTVRWLAKINGSGTRWIRASTSVGPAQFSVLNRGPAAP